MGLEKFFINPRLKVKALEKCLGREFEQIAKADSIFCQQRQMVTRLPLSTAFPMKATSRSDIGLVANDRIDSGLSSRSVELERSVQIPMVGDRQGIHAEFNGA